MIRMKTAPRRAKTDEISTRSALAVCRKIVARFPRNLELVRQSSYPPWHSVRGIVLKADAPLWGLPDSYHTIIVIPPYS